MKIEDLKVGDKVNYHGSLGQGVISSNHEIKDIESKPNNFGCDVAWVTGKAGCVDIEHLELM